MSEWMKIIDENHTMYGACYQNIKWCPEAIAGYKKPNGYIVQKFMRKSEPINSSLMCPLGLEVEQSINIAMDFVSVQTVIK